MHLIPCHVVAGSIADVWVELLWVAHGCVIVGSRPGYGVSKKGSESRALPGQVRDMIPR